MFSRTPLKITNSGKTRTLSRCAWQACYSSSTIQEHDVVLVRQKGPKRQSKRLLSPPIRGETALKVAYGATIQGSDAIGKTLPTSVLDNRGNRLRLHELSLSQYVTNSPRVATPIYPHDAALIVSMLDLNPPVPGEDPLHDAGLPLEIFDAGTGMGCLTLHLARAVHGANPAVPPSLRKALCEAPYSKGNLPRHKVTDTTPATGLPPHALDLVSPELQSQLEDHLSSRRAVIHSLDINPTSSRRAHDLVRGFRRAQYLLDIDFHVQTIRSYLDERLAQNGGEPFLSHAILDLPSPEDHADIVAQCLRPDGKLIFFTPSITQAINIAVWANETNQPLYLDHVTELQPSTFTAGFHDGVGGREWDVRIATVRNSIEAEDSPPVISNERLDTPSEGESSGEEQTRDPRKALVCRPKVGNIVGGGGFLTIFTRRMPQLEESHDGQETTTGP